MVRRLFMFIAGLLAGLALVAAGRAWLDARDRAEWGEDERAMAPRMHAFVRALREPPGNADPSAHWRPLLAESAPEGLLCSLCHGSRGERMESAIRRGHLPVQAGAAALERDAMIALMEEWVQTLNRKGGPLLRKAVVCIDCHERDPRG